MAANLYTGGQFFGLLFVMLLGIAHGDQRVLPPDGDHDVPDHAAPRPRSSWPSWSPRSLLGLVFWLVTTVAQPDRRRALPGRPRTYGTSSASRRSGGRSLLNALAYALWAILGVGVGVLIRSQIGATLTAVDRSTWSARPAAG